MNEFQTIIEWTIEEYPHLQVQLEHIEDMVRKSVENEIFEGKLLIKKLIEDNAKITSN